MEMQGKNDGSLDYVLVSFEVQVVLHRGESSPENSTTSTATVVRVAH